MKSFESCILKKHPECSPDKWFMMTILPYFCGHNDNCLDLNNKWALREAKRNIEKSFAVIGVLEHMNTTLEVLQKKLPSYFRGAKNLYLKKINSFHINQNNRKQNVSEKVKQYLRANLNNDYELYYYCIQRLYSQFKRIIN